MPRKEKTVPYKPKHPCAYPGCPELVEPGKRYCEKHTKKEAKTYEKYGRDRSVHRRYGRVWSRIRARYVKEHPFCELCFQRGVLVPVEEVHHIIPLAPENITDPSITLNEENLISLCRNCHRQRHGEYVETRYTVDELGRVHTSPFDEKK